MRIVYLAGPITAIGKEAAMEREAALMAALVDLGAATFAPAHAWCVPGGVEGARGRIQHVDDAAIAICDVVIVTYLDGIGSVGTDHEVELALSLGKPILLYVPGWGTQDRNRYWGWRWRVGLGGPMPWSNNPGGTARVLLQVMRDRDENE